MMKLTPAMKKALQWFSERERVCLFGAGDPSKVIRDRLLMARLIETAGSEKRGAGFGFTYFRINDEGRAALAASEGRAS